jgi:hypothetical protein
LSASGHQTLAAQEPRLGARRPMIAPSLQKTKKLGPQHHPKRTMLCLTSITRSCRPGLRPPGGVAGNHLNGMKLYVVYDATL